MLCNHHHHPSPELGHLPKQKLCPIKHIIFDETKLSHHVYTVIRQVWEVGRLCTRLESGDSNGPRFSIQPFPGKLYPHVTWLSLHDDPTDPLNRPLFLGDN